MSLMSEIGEQTPTMAEIIRAALRGLQLEINTMFPGEVISYNPLNQTCEVQISLKKTKIDPPAILSRPRLLDVPVVFPRSGTGGTFFPLKKGDTVMLVFCQRSMDDWTDNGGEVEVRDTRLHNITDAVAIPGLFPLSGVISPAQAADATEVRGNKILIGKSGTSSEPMVLGKVLQTNLENLIAAVEDLVSLLTLGQVLGTVPTTAVPLGAPCTSTIVTSPVESALTAVKNALPGENSDFIFGE